ncbi:MAG TPA: exodeoxyribonuclease VII large subunit [Candidatus Scybalocola faecipullorum]|nr:exodeoxyribonuclease VII large subunit [Candidatus Scybalocola faecipullorum]
MKEIYSVSSVNQYIRQMFESDYALNHIYVKGEISNCKYHTSGHIYFTLKDKNAAIACVMFKGMRGGLSFRLTEGLSVIVLGSISVYERDGKYQLYAREIVRDGIGLLYAQYEQLKNKLAGEGLFDETHKKPLPLYAKKIGIVTAGTGAAIQDIINISARRNPYVQLVLYPAKVQGDGAAETIAAGIAAMDAYGVDVMIVGRGGGSIEDLWAFNEEIVARAIYACKTPVISAVGHETDFTIADFVSDRRAPTPSAAAELACADVMSLLRTIDEYSLRLDRAMAGQIGLWRQKIKTMETALKHLSPKHLMQQKRQYLMLLEERLTNKMTETVKAYRHRLETDVQKLEALSPLARLSGGYAFVTDENEAAVRSVSDVREGSRLKISVTDGTIFAQVQKTAPAKPAGKERTDYGTNKVIGNDNGGA